AIEAAGVRVDVTCQVLDDLVWVADCRYRLTDAFGADAGQRKHSIEQAIDAALLEQSGSGADGLHVRYSVVLVGPCPDPEHFAQEHAVALARLVRSLPKPPSDRQVMEILQARASYSQTDLTIVDWVGGVIITDPGGHQYDIELLKIGNYQLLRYRMLDRAI